MFSSTKPLMSKCLYSTNFEGQIYMSFQAGQIQIFNLDTYKIRQFYETDSVNALKSFCISSNLLPQRHLHCPNQDDNRKLLVGVSTNGAFMVYCTSCLHFIASWKLGELPIIQMEEIPNTSCLLVLTTNSLNLYKSESTTLDLISSTPFDEHHVPFLMKIINQKYIVVGMESGTAAIISINIQENIQLELIKTIKLHSGSIYKILPCTDILKIEGAEEVFENEELHNYFVSLGKDSSLVIVDVQSGIIQYSFNTPVCKHNISFAFTYYRKLMIALVIDQNVRLLDWPIFERKNPTPLASPRPEIIDVESPIPETEPQQVNLPEETHVPSSRSSIQSEIIEPTYDISTLHKIFFPELYSNLVSTPSQQKISLIPINQSEEEHVDLVMENGQPKINCYWSR